MSTTLASPTKQPSVDPLSRSKQDALREATAMWAATTMRARLGVIRRLRNELPAMEKEFCQALQTDLHKPEAETIAAELLPVAGACRFLEKRAAGILKPRKVSFFDTPNYLFGEK